MQDNTDIDEMKKNNEKIGGKRYAEFSHTTREQVKEAARILLNAIELHDNDKRRICLRNFKNGDPRLSQEIVGSCSALNKILGNRIESHLDRQIVRTAANCGYFEIDLVFTYKPDAAPALRAFLIGVEKIKRKIYFSNQKGITDDDGHKYPIVGTRAQLVQDLWELNPNESLPGSHFLDGDFKSTSTLSHAINNINKVFRKEFPPPCDLIENGPNGYFLNRESFDFSPIKRVVS